MSYDNTVLQQQEAIRRSGETNMFDVNTVQRLANERGFYDLVAFIEEADGVEYIDMAKLAAEQYRGEELDV